MATLPISVFGEVIILSMEYDPSGLQWCRIWDNHALGWLVSDAVPAADPPTTTRGASHIGGGRPGGRPGATRAERSFDDGERAERAVPAPDKPVTTGEHAPLPIILGSLAKASPDTAPIASPQWGKYDDPVVFLPDTGRLGLSEFLTWLATNNGAARRIGSMVALSKSLSDGYQQWAGMHPDLAFAGEPQSAAPVNVDVPYLGPESPAVGDTLECTMGNWDGMQGTPATYSYAWYSDEEEREAIDHSYIVAEADLGHAITCVVTATNMAGGTAAPPSNAVTVAEATAAASAVDETPEPAEQRHARRR
jgi:hypothetical protein